MKKKLLFSALYFISAFSLIIAQNLVPNSGFEVQDSCPAVSQIHLAPPWVTATLGTPDLFNSTCPTQNSAGRTGIGSSGVFTYNTFANNREYMEAPLTTPLISGETYCVSFYVKRTAYRYACNRIGAYFSTSLINQSTTSVLSFTPQVQNNPATLLSSSTSWTQVSGSFVASGGESHIVIGSFSNDLNTDTVVITTSSTNKVCYYKIDDVSVINCFVGVEETTLNSRVSLFPNPTSDNFTIKLPAHVSINSVLIYNNLGQVMKKIESPENIDGTVTCNNLEFPIGIYYVVISTDKEIVNKKLIVNK